jgi:hypothetical protein
MVSLFLFTLHKDRNEIKIFYYDILEIGTPPDAKYFLFRCKGRILESKGNEVNSHSEATELILFRPHI